MRKRACSICGVDVRNDNVTGLCRKHSSEARIGKSFAPLSLDDIAQRRVDRDPCTYCGTRGDIGCKHRRAAA